MEPSQNLLQIVFSKYGSTLVPRRERGYSQFSCYIDSALASTGYKKLNRHIRYTKKMFENLACPKNIPGPFCSTRNHLKGSLTNSDNPDREMPYDGDISSGSA